MATSVLEQVIAGNAPEIQRLTVEQFHRMIESGILRDGDPVELIDGLLVRKDRSDAGGNPMIHGPRHALCVKRLQRLDRMVEPFGCHLHCQLPVTLSDSHEPEPDVAVVRGVAEDYQDRHPRVEDILAVIEVADSSLDYDRRSKREVYAASGVPVYWIVSIPDGRIEVYNSPNTETGEYEKQAFYAAGDDAQLPVDDRQRLDVPVTSILG